LSRWIWKELPIKSLLFLVKLDVWTGAIILYQIKRYYLVNLIIKGTRISVELILELNIEGWMDKMILESYPNISADSLKSVYTYLKDCVEYEFYF